ncbi:MAG: sensor histidine kinase [Lachnospiraceae bacterium]|uniref:histidine kinase n=1 Tax=Candidatus Weimeria bifida TaxID=2599074 RepID=A0A6N7J0P3_9FIRM|nr:HAMP domain-containing histidine kinase [Candidatus Weimeria bifida]RRF95888.1 MAG: sensor histidine kinase [Lachnospiraceae bacterium]
MKLKTKFILNILLIVLLPIVLIFIFASFATRTKARSSGSHPGNLYFSNSVDDLAAYTDSDVMELTELAKNHPEKFLDKDAVKRENSKLAKKNSYLVVVADSKLTYDGAANGMRPIYSELPQYGRLKKGDVLLIRLQKERGLLKEVDFKTRGQTGQVFVITPAGSIVPGSRKIVCYYLFWLVAILFITGIVASMLLYRNMIKKVRQMQQAAENIHEGDLDTKIEVRGNDELTELAQSMERMRVKLLSNAEQKVADEESNRQFMSNISHDLKTPLTSIIGYSEGILDGIAKDPEKLKKYVGTIHTKAVDMNALLNELSEFLKLDMHEIPYHFDTINANGYFDDFAEETWDELADAGADFSYKNTLPTDTVIFADPAQINRVLHNLVSNAIKYRREDTKLSVEFRVHDAGDFIQAELCDNGRGISPEDVPHVFDRLFRADKARNTGIRGNGIGLSIVKQIVEDHGGQVWVTSRKNEGSTFYFMLKKIQQHSAAL